jgi:hypothetical protein
MSYSNAQCRKQVENIVFEGLDLVRRVLPFLRREFSGVPENPSGAVCSSPLLCIINNISS